MPKSLFIAPRGESPGPKLPPGPLRRLPARRLFSLAALRRAWLKVKAVGGAPGVDGISVEQFEAHLEANLARLQQCLLAGRYKPQPVQRFFVPKADGTLRPLSMWAVGDKLVQRVVYDCIEPYFERVFLGCSFGYRPGRGVKQAVQAVFALQQQHRRWVVDLDIQDCFEAFDKKLMLRFVREQVQDRLILRLIRAWLGARVLSDGGSGVSQGAVISPLLANIYLHQLDVALTRQQYQVVRYADDVVICCRTKKEAQHSLAGVTAALARLKLAPNPHKTRIVHVDEGFKFVGHFFLRNEVFRL